MFIIKIKKAEVFIGKITGIDSSVHVCL